MKFLRTNKANLYSYVQIFALNIFVFVLITLFVLSILKIFLEKLLKFFKMEKNIFFFFEIAVIQTKNIEEIEYSYNRVTKYYFKTTLSSEKKEDCIQVRKEGFAKD